MIGAVAHFGEQRGTGGLPTELATRVGVVGLLIEQQRISQRS